MELTDSALERIATQLDVAARRRSDTDRRIWIATPYIGSTVGALVAAHGGAVKLRRPSLSLRLLTDLNPTAIAVGTLSFDALEAFGEAGFDMGSLMKLHAKVVIIDDWALVGSANLSQGGGYRNHELGVVFSAGLPDSLLRQFDAWWADARPFECAKIKRSFHAFENTASRPATQPRARLPRGQMNRSIGPAAKRLFARNAADELQKVCALRAPLPGKQVIAEAARTRSYRQVSSVAHEEPSAEVRARLFANVVRYHHDVGARVRAANHLREVATSEGPPAALLALRRAYRHDPTRSWSRRWPSKPCASSATRPGGPSTTRARPDPHGAGLTPTRLVVMQSAARAVAPEVAPRVGYGKRRFQVSDLGSRPI